jgi:predicted dehydrogenase/nucleoside-diphosphate-sugar epimerase
MTQTRVAIVGAGFIAASHVDALRMIKNVAITAVVDPNRSAAERLAAQAPGATAFASVAEALAAGVADRAHVLVPPPLHAGVGAELLRAGLPTLIEKPLAVTSAEAAALVAAAAERKTLLGVNQNFMFDPLLTRFAADLKSGKYGRLRHVGVSCAVPLRQFAARQFSHWMFEAPTNIILEQMIHPLSQLASLLGPLQVTSAIARPAVEVAPGLAFHRGFDVSLTAGAATAQLHMSFPENYPTWQIDCLCDDALVTLDLWRGNMVRLGRTRYLEEVDNGLVDARAGLSKFKQAAVRLTKYAAGHLKLISRSDPFFRSMLASIRAFHHAADTKSPFAADGAFAAHLVDLCEDIARRANISREPAPRPKNLARRDDAPSFDVAVLGGTGFIGKATVERLVAQGYSVGVLARGTRGLPQAFHAPSVTLIEGNVTRRDDVARGIGRAKFVVNLAHGGASGSRQAIIDAMVGSADAVAQVCLAQGVERLVHISSIAALYLGNPNEVITAATPADTQGAERADYSFAKAEAERALLALHRDKALPVTIQRPGVVVGEGTSPFHSGVGLFNNEQHCIGWSSGRNPLPFVLVEDCADAILCALKAGPDIVGRTDNIVGPIRLSAREYIEELAKALGRPLVYHPSAVWRMQAVEIGKWLIKRAGGRTVPWPSARDLQSRGMLARFDTSQTEAALNWHPKGDRVHFLERGINAPAKAMDLD